MVFNWDLKLFELLNRVWKLTTPNHHGVDLLAWLKS